MDDKMMNAVVARQMSKQTGLEIKQELVAKLPDDGCPGHMGLPRWDVYAARAGEFTVLAYVYEDGEIRINIV